MVLIPRFIRRTLTLAALPLACVAMITTTVACGPVKRPDGGSGLLPVGSSAPDVVGKDSEQHQVRLADLRGKPVVIYFYPSDGTPGCTTEACAFRDAWKRYDEEHVAIIGVSNNSEESHRKFIHDEHLPFPLAADDSGSIGTAYGVSKHVWGYDRVSFLIDKDGKVAHVWPSVDPGVHADAVLDEARRLPH